MNREEVVKVHNTSCNLEANLQKFTYPYEPCVRNVNKGMRMLAYHWCHLGLTVCHFLPWLSTPATPRWEDFCKFTEGKRRHVLRIRHMWETHRG